MQALFKQSESTAARRRWFFGCVDDTDGKTAETGLTFSAGELQISKAGGAFANFAGTVTELSDGMYMYQATAAELDTLGIIGFKVEKTGVRTQIMMVGQVIPWDFYDIATAVLDAVYEGSRTLRGFFRVARSVLVNKANTLTTAPAFRDDADSKNRVSFAMSGGNATRTPTVDET